MQLKSICFSCLACLAPDSRIVAALSFAGRAVLFGLLAIVLLGPLPHRVDASLPLSTGDQQLTRIAAAPAGGFWVQADHSHRNSKSVSLAKEGAPVFENVPQRGSLAAIPGNNGYWVCPG
jgi:hypothetical protein